MEKVLRWWAKLGQGLCFCARASPEFMFVFGVFFLGHL